MKILVAYYSLEGSTKKIAQQIAAELAADLLEIQPVREFPKTAGWKFVVGGFSSTMNQYCPIRKPDLNPYDYDLWIIGAPVWAWRPAPPLISFLKQYPPKSTIQIAPFLTHQGSMAQAMERLKSMYRGTAIATERGFHTGEEHKDALVSDVANWVEELRQLLNN